MSRIVAAMSGGVDSSVAAALLVREGHDVIGVSLQLSDESEGGSVSRCCSSADLRDARRVAGAIGIPHYVVNEEEGFERSVIGPFLEGYRQGRTPNPCVRCNSDLKFGSLALIARSLGAGKVATGHYARVGEDPVSGRRRLMRGADAAKDQSYFLFDLDADQLAMAVFPLGSKTKDDAYRLAREFDLPVAGKPESQDLCFIPGGDTRAYLARRLPGGPGEIVREDGEVVGRHGGVHLFTIGQRRGLGIAASEPLYVRSLDATESRVIVGSEEPRGADLLARSCRLSDESLWRRDFRCRAKIRSRHAAAPATVSPREDGRLAVRFDEAQPAITPGQAVVFYDDDVVLGGGWIEPATLAPAGEGRVACERSMAERA